MASKRNKRLIAQYGGKVMPYRDLPVPAQLAIGWYMTVDGEAWKVPPDFSERPLKAVLPWLVRRYGSTRIGYVEIPTKALMDVISEDEEFGERGIRDFDDYHEWFISQGGMPDHPRKGRWPVILSSFEEETLQDGWHRLHDYYSKGAKKIPAVYFP